MSALEEYFSNIREYLHEVDIKERSERIVAIDVLKGIAILLVILAHLARWVLVPEWKWAYYLIYMVLDVFGPSLFVFLSCLGVVFSVKKKRANLNEKLVRTTVLQRAFALLFFAFIINYGLCARNMGVLGFWLWSVLQFIAFGQIITYYILKLQPHQRMIIAFLIAYSTPKMFTFLTELMANNGINFKQLTLNDLSNPYAFIYWLIFYSAEQVPFFPWIEIVIIGSIVGENMVNAYNAYLEGNKIVYKKFNRHLFTDGFIMAIVGILVGLQLQSDDFGLGILEGINTSPFIEWPGIPDFLVHSSVSNIIYSTGMELILLAIAFRITEIKNHKGRIAKLFTFYGRYSLSLFGLHIIFFIGTKDSLGPVNLFILYFFVFFSLGFLLYILRYRYHGVGTLEWLILAIGRLHKIKGTNKKKKDLMI
ncbi:MAG: heparan-alpha-glucosaminide N-acetyltransferase domain-containing protein [Promethearchaeota archaeon]